MSGMKKPEVHQTDMVPTFKKLEPHKDIRMPTAKQTSTTQCPKGHA